MKLHYWNKLGAGWRYSELVWFQRTATCFWGWCLGPLRPTFNPGVGCVVCCLRGATCAFNNHFKIVIIRSPASCVLPSQGYAFLEWNCWQIILEPILMFLSVLACPHAGCLSELLLPTHYLHAWQGGKPCSFAVVFFPQTGIVLDQSYRLKIYNRSDYKITLPLPPSSPIFLGWKPAASATTSLEEGRKSRQARRGSSYVFCIHCTANIPCSLETHDPGI